MQFRELIGQKAIKTHLQSSATTGRVAHAQLFVGAEGSGTLVAAIAYAQLLLSKKEDDTNCAAKFKNFSHPDLHFIFPTVSNETIKTKPKSIDFISDWRIFLKDNPYGSLFDWYQILDVKNKQGEIRVDDAQEIIKTLALKSFEGGYKIMIIWMSEKINIAASNKLLKLLEEPTDNTLFILIAENEGDIIQTIRSRCQVLHFSKLLDADISDALITQKNIEPDLANKIARMAQGNFNKALQLLVANSEDAVFEKWYIDWVRSAFRAKGNKTAILELISWSENIAALGRETQKKFLEFCINMFRQALLLNYQLPDLVYFEPKVEKFELKNLAPFVNGGNINDIFQEISDAMYHIERNGNAKIVLTDLSIKLTRLIHKKQ